MQVLSKARTLQRIAISLEDMHVIANPLLDEDCKECCRKAENEGHEPEGIHPDVGCQRFECRERSRGGRRDGDLRRDGGDLMRNLIEDDNILSEVIHHLVCRTDFQVLFAVNYECGECSGK